MCTQRKHMTSQAKLGPRRARARNGGGVVLGTSRTHIGPESYPPWPLKRAAKPAGERAAAGPGDARPPCHGSQQSSLNFMKEGRSRVH